MLKQPRKPPNLYHLQKWFSKVITSKITSLGKYNLPLLKKADVQEARKKITFGKVLKPEQRIAIYQQQYWLRLIRVLKKEFPFLLRLFGEDSFTNEIAVPYFLQFPSNSWTLNWIGDRLNLWVDRYYEKGEDKELVFLASQIDFAYTKIFWAGNLSPVKKITEQKKIFLQPFIELFQLDADLFNFRKKLLEKEVKYWEENDFPLLKWDRKYYFVLFRHKKEFYYEEISQPEFSILGSFQKGATLQEVVFTLGEKRSKQIEKNMIKWFRNWSASGWLGEKSQ